MTRYLQQMHVQICSLHRQNVNLDEMWMTTYCTMLILGLLGPDILGLGYWEQEC